MVERAVIAMFARVRALPLEPLTAAVVFGVWFYRRRRRTNGAKPK